MWFCHHNRHKYKHNRAGRKGIAHASKSLASGWTFPHDLAWLAGINNSNIYIYMVAWARGYSSLPRTRAHTSPHAQNILTTNRFTVGALTSRNKQKTTQQRTHLYKYVWVSGYNVFLVAPRNRVVWPPHPSNMLRGPHSTSQTRLRHLKHGGQTTLHETQTCQYRRAFMNMVETPPKNQSPP
jgi:hypothetical protein